MPIYTYQCGECGHTHEAQRLIGERNDSERCRADSCPGIASRVQETRAPGAAFKGTGWTPKSGGGRTE